MRGNNITNVYIIDGKEVSIKEITKNQSLLIESYENRTLYNDFRNRVLVEKGDDVVCTIKIRIPEMVFEAENEFGILL